MALSKNEQVALFIVVFLVVAVAGLFIFILPAREQIAPNQKALEEKKAELAQLEAELGDAKFAEVGAEIMEAYRLGVGASAAFWDYEMEDWQADRHLQEILTGAGLFTANMEITQLSTISLALNDFVPPVIGYNIKTQAGRLAASSDTLSPDDFTSYEYMVRALSGAARNRALDNYKQWLEDSSIDNGDIVRAMRTYLTNESEVVGAQLISFTIPLDAVQADRLSMYVFEMDDATHIRKMDVGDEWEGENAALDQVATAYLAVPEEGTGDAPPPPGDDTAPGDGGDEPVIGPRAPGGLYEYEIDIVFYIIEPMKEPSAEGFVYLKFPA